MGFVIAKNDTSLFTFKHGEDMTYLLLCVDDIILCTSSDALCGRLIFHLKTKFSMSDLGPLNYFLRNFLSRNPTYMILCQQKYEHKILECADMKTCKPNATPVNTNAKLSADVGPPVADPTQYPRLAGALHYLTFTRPDIVYSVQQVYLFMHDPREPHLYALKRILRYIQDTIDLRLHLYPISTLRLITYTDADWGDNLISWSTKRHPTLSRSSAEAYCNPVQQQHTKHMKMDIHFVREKVTMDQVRVLHVLSRYQFADIFTKSLPQQLFLDFKSSLSVRPPSTTTAGVR
ncbi:uncharacterized mitochondrial protein AtMg00810-like [Spinacia oleracea]|uniref:Uncharacterized mitochondrial protein AtMg00810-like n=1 Tax=Spinacia oleracea TaxID=3562 RepID=A0A9R0JS02_SPIOL|nr:uncharacterized mitochondrial protein AtMg00810-like [Spinacia oleracea]